MNAGEKVRNAINALHVARKAACEAVQNVMVAEQIVKDREADAEKASGEVVRQLKVVYGGKSVLYNGKRYAIKPDNSLAVEETEDIFLPLG